MDVSAIHSWGPADSAGERAGAVVLPPPHSDPKAHQDLVTRMSGASLIQQPAKPGTACLGCRSRKLKCSREEEGCSNCLKGELPCVYPIAETGAKRKRGPYKKDKASRERHLEDLVKYLEPKDTSQPSRGHSDEGYGDSVAASATSGPESSNSVKLRIDAGRHIRNSEDLVKDALIALTSSHLPENEAEENGRFFPLRQPNAANEMGGIAVHPPARRIFEYWHLYVIRVDPMLKIIHRPSFGEKLLVVMDDLQAADPVTETLLFAIYYSAVSTCTAREARKQFGEDRRVLLQRYGRIIESTLSDNYSMPVLESLQALVMYIVAMRRDDSLTSIRALFSLAVRMAQLIGLHKDPGDGYPPYEAEMRRRLWWHICALESRGAEEGAARQASIIDGCNVQLPGSLNDLDIAPEMKDRAEPRTSITDMTWVLLKWETVRLVHQLKIVKRSRTDHSDAGVAAMKLELKKMLEINRLKVNNDFLSYMHPSRPMDWMCIAWIELMLIKCRFQVDFAPGQIPTKDMSTKDRFNLLQGSVDILRLYQAVVSYKAVEQWAWYFRGWVQWHSIAIVVAELGHNKNQQFINNAWSVLDPVLADWDRVFDAKRDEPAWEHVNKLISRARESRQQMPAERDEDQMDRSDDGQSVQPKTTTKPSRSKAAPTAPFSAIWQGDWTAAAMGGTLPIDPNSPFNPNSFTSHLSQPQPMVSLTPATGHASGNATGSTPAEPPQDWTLDYIGGIGGMDDIDFSAFEGVFEDTAWNFSSPSTDVSMGVGP